MAVNAAPSLARRTGAVAGRTECARDVNSRRAECETPPAFVSRAGAPERSDEHRQEKLKIRPHLDVA